jgi:hypothetical protein
MELPDPVGATLSVQQSVTRSTTRASSAREVTRAEGRAAPSTGQVGQQVKRVPVRRVDVLDHLRDQRRRCLAEVVHELYVGIFLDVGIHPVRMALTHMQHRRGPVNQ